MGAVSRTLNQASVCTTGQQSTASRSLPPEIIIYIAELLLGMERTRDLAMLSLLRRTLWPVIQGILFSHITLWSFPRCYRLTETLRSGRSTLPPLVCRITAVLDTEPRIEEQLFLAKHLTDLYTLCPMLSHITLAGGRDGGPGEMLFPDILDAPRLSALSTIESLTLTGPPSNFGPWLLLHLPKIRELRLFGGTLISQFSGPSPSPGEGLRHVTWGLASPPTLKMVKWLFANSSQVIGGSLTLITPPTSLLEIERIREYCLIRDIRLWSVPPSSRDQIE